MEYNLKVIHELVKTALTLEDFNNLVFYDFRNVYDNFTEGQQQDARIRLLIDYADKHGEIDKLLESIKKQNEKVYNKFSDRIFETTQLKKSTEQEDQGINQLREDLKSLSMEKLEPIYLLFRPDNADQNVNNINEILTQLNRILPSQKYRRIIPFVLKIKQDFYQLNQSLNQSLENWLSQYGNLFGYANFLEIGYANFLETPNPRSSSSSSSAPNSPESSLLIEIRKINPDYLQLKAWFWSSQLRRTIQEKELIAVKNEQSEINQRYQKLSDKFTELIKEVNREMKRVGSKKLRIELFLTTGLLQEDNCYIDWVKIKKADFLIELCKQYLVIFRLAERLDEDHQDLQENWEKKWHQVTLNNCSMVDYCQNIDNLLNQYTTIGIKLDTVSNYKDFFRKIYLKALPIALWSRCDLQTLSCLDEINRILTRVQNDFRQLPQAIQEEINAAEPGTEHIGHHICLLWDDPERMPPDPKAPENALMAM